MLTVGLTGSIAVGKTFVAGVLRENGLHVLDADNIARVAVERGTPGLERIVETFGTNIVTSDGELDRKKLGAIVFADAEKRAQLNAIVHPLVFDAQDRWIRSIYSEERNAIVVVDAALMIESGGYHRFNKIIVVWCDAAIQLQRLIERDRLDTVTAKMRIAAQMSQDEKKQHADYLIETTHGFDAARIETERVVNELRSTPHE
ncbi:MAG: dephospho-CoA kinase [Blastocatellia bacterium]|nr:dephospho-CoA kinase [Blastocatellia bacterium]